MPQDVETRDPTTDAVLGEVPAGNAADIDDAVKAAQQAFDGGWKDASPGERQRVLSEMAHAVEENRKTLATLEVLDTGKTITEAMGDMGLVIDHLTYYAAAARNVNGETRRTTTSSTGRNRSSRRPLRRRRRNDRGTSRCSSPSGSAVPLSPPATRWFSNPLKRRRCPLSN